jgi:hypothetical protein
MTLVFACSHYERLQCGQWKLVDKSIKRIFEELAKEGKQLHRERSLKYNKDEIEHSVNSQDTENDDSFDKMLMFNDEIEKEVKDADKDKSSTSTLPQQTLRARDISHSTTSNESPKYDRVNIVTPITSKPKVELNFGRSSNNSIMHEMEVDTDQDDEFCQFIDGHIHLVDDTEKLDSVDLDDSVPKTFMDLITIDETVDLFTLTEV